MRIKVELHPDVVWFIRHRCHEPEVDAFYQALERIRSQPIGASEGTSDRRLSRYRLRFVWFGANIAVFKYDAAKDRIRVLECRKLAPRGRLKPRARDPDEGP